MWFACGFNNVVSVTVVSNTCGFKFLVVSTVVVSNICGFKLHYPNTSVPVEYIIEKTASRTSVP